MIVENTEENREIKRVAASMAIEEMYFDQEFRNEMIKVSKNEKTTEEVIKGIIRKYGR